MPAFTFTTRPEISGSFGAVASTHWLAAAVGMRMLEKGGNAFDAAAAAGFTLQVVEPHLNGPLGEAPILLWSAAERRCAMICGQGLAPQAATIGRFRALGLDLIPGSGTAAAEGGAGLGEPTLARLGVATGDTCHVDTVDRWGNMVSATPSGGWLQSSPVIPELGVCLGTRLQMSWLEEGLPASLAPGKRPRSTLSPSLALRDGE